MQNNSFANTPIPCYTLTMKIAQVGIPLSEEIKEKLRIRAKEPDRIKTSIANLPKYTKDNHPTLGLKWTPERRVKMLLAFKKSKRIPWNKGKSGVQDCSHLRGANHPNWKGGKSSIKKQVYDSFQYKKCRKQCFERDNYTCQICLVKGGELQADHIKPYALYPELRFNLRNLRTLCVGCHRKTPTWGYSSMYRKQKYGNTK